MILRRLLLVSALVAALAPAATVTSSAATPLTAQASLLSSGKGTQAITGGGLTFGTVSRGGQIVIRDIAGDLGRLVVSGHVVSHALPDGARQFVVVGKNGASFKFSGGRYQLILRGSSTLNGIGVYGKAVFHGFGTYQLSGGEVTPWNGAVSLGHASRQG